MHPPIPLNQPEFGLALFLALTHCDIDVNRLATLTGLSSSALYSYRPDGQALQPRRATWVNINRALSDIWPRDTDGGFIPMAETATNGGADITPDDLKTLLAMVSDIVKELAEQRRILDELRGIWS